MKIVMLDEPPKFQTPEEQLFAAEKRTLWARTLEDLAVLALRTLRMPEDDPIARVETLLDEQRELLAHPDTVRERGCGSPHTSEQLCVRWLAEAIGFAMLCNEA